MSPGIKQQVAFVETVHQAIADLRRVLLDLDDAEAEVARNVLCCVLELFIEELKKVQR